MQETETPTKKIFKYPLPLDAEQTLQLPAGAQILSVITQQGKIMLYALITPKNELEDYSIIILGTGHRMNESPLNEGYTFLGTVASSNIIGNHLVWHIFYKKL